MSPSAGSVSAHPHGDGILVMEDDQTIQRALAQLFQIEGFNVERADNGAEALRRFAEGYRPCLIILDLMMPVMDGIQFLDEIKRLPGAADIPVIVLSGNSRVMEKVAGKNVVEALIKPVDIDHLISVARRYC